MNAEAITPDVDDLPRPGAAWDNSGPSLKELLAREQHKQERDTDLAILYALAGATYAIDDAISNLTRVTTFDRPIAGGADELICNNVGLRHIQANLAQLLSQHVAATRCIEPASTPPVPQDAPPAPTPTSASAAPARPRRGCTGEVRNEAQVWEPS